MNHWQENPKPGCTTLHVQSQPQSLYFPLDLALESERQTAVHATIFLQGTKELPSSIVLSVHACGQGNLKLTRMLDRAEGLLVYVEGPDDARIAKHWLTCRTLSAVGRASTEMNSLPSVTVSACRTGTFSRPCDSFAKTLTVHIWLTLRLRQKTQ